MPRPAASLDQAATFPRATSLCSNRHSDRCTGAAHLPRFRALALLGRLPSERVDGGVIRRPRNCTRVELGRPTKLALVLRAHDLKLESLADKAIGRCVNAQFKPLTHDGT